MVGLGVGKKIGARREVDMDALESRWERNNRKIEEQDGNRMEGRRVPRMCVEVVTMDEKTDVSRRTREWDEELNKWRVM